MPDEMTSLCDLCGRPDHGPGEAFYSTTVDERRDCNNCGHATDRPAELVEFSRDIHGDEDGWIVGYACSPECELALDPRAIDPGYRRAHLARLKGCKTDGDDGLPSPFGSTNNTTEKEN